MKRLERTIKRKRGNSKNKLFLRICFMFVMVIVLMICIYIVDNNAKMMLGIHTKLIDFDPTSFFNLKWK